MNKLVSLGILVACAAVSLFFAVASYEVAHTGFVVRFDLDNVTKHVNTQVDSLNTARLSQDTGKLLVDAKNLVAHSDILVAKESKTVDTWNRQFTTTLSNVNGLVAHLDASQTQITSAAVGTLSSANQTLAATTTAVNTANTTLATTNTMIAATDTTIADVDKFVNAPELKTTVTNVNQMVDIADQVELKATHDYLHPKPMSPIKKAWKVAEPWLLIGGHVAASIY